MKRIVLLIIRVGLPLFLGFAILWWMYRDMSGAAFTDWLLHRTHWGWMAVSLLLGVVPGVVRALRWQQALAPLDEHPRRSVCCDAIFLSYAASLVIPRAGEVTRCVTLKRTDGISFTKSLGTVVTERLVDSSLMLLFTALAFFSQLPVLLRFLDTTGFNLRDVLRRFSATGYLVTAVCLVAIAILMVLLFKRLKMLQKGRDMMHDVIAGVLSLRHVRNLPLYLVYSGLIWAGYFFHFYTAFFCFDVTAHISLSAVFLIFCIGSFAVLVPTPNGAGPWHFAVKTMLVLYGVAEAPAIMFALVVHTVQTALVILLGVGAWLHLSLAIRPRRPATSPADAG